MIQIQFEKDNHRSAVYDDGALVGCCDFQVSDQSWVITHTEVDPSYGGQGLAKKLVLCVAEQAKADGVRIIPVCSYAKKVL